MSGTVGKAPTVRIATPLRVPSTQTQLAVTGSGPQIQIDQLFVLELTLYNARTGAKATSTTDPGQQPVVAKSSDDTLFPALVAALAGKPQGSRVVVALSPADAFAAGGSPPPGLERTDPVVVVADVVAVPPPVVPQAADRASGSPQPVPTGTPEVLLTGDEPTGIRVPTGTRPPTSVVTVPLLRGSGAPVRDRSLVTLHVLGQGWGRSVPLVDTYFKEPVLVPVGAPGSVPSWNQALVGLPVGSRVLVIDPSPPEQVPGGSERAPRETIVWVIDVLGAS